MVRTCVYPGCSHKAVSWSPYCFHRVPLNDISLRKQWLTALNIDTNTPRSKLRQLRVCSDHFSEEDYVKPPSNKTNKYLLKSCAVPAPQKRDTSVVEETPAGEDKSSDIPETSTAAEEKPPLLHVVDEEAILQLMKNCPMCNKKCRCTKHTRGPYFIVYQSCYFCHYQRKWASQPEAMNMNIQKAHTQPKKKPQPKERASVKAKDQSPQPNKMPISKSSVSDSRDSSETQ